MKYTTLVYALTFCQKKNNSSDGKTKMGKQWELERKKKAERERMDIEKINLE